jgi:hypothetical protein
MRHDRFALREFLTDSITSVFFSLTIDGRLRFFHAYCDLFDKGVNRRAKLTLDRRPILTPL